MYELIARKHGAETVRWWSRVAVLRPVLAAAGTEAFSAGFIAVCGKVFVLGDVLFGDARTCQAAEPERLSEEECNDGVKEYMDARYQAILYHGQELAVPTL